MENDIKVGDKIPEFTVKGFDGFEFETEDLIEKPSVFYFYSKDDTPVSTAEACSFRDNMSKFDKMHVNVYGISPDNPDSHARFIQKYDLNFFMLCDESLAVARKFGVVKPGIKKEIIHSTFVVDKKGIVRWMEKPIKAEEHVQRVLEEVKELTK